MLTRLTADDGTLSVLLQCHLFAESLLEELIRLALGTNSQAVLAVKLTFDQKLTIASRLRLRKDWDLLPDYVVGSLRKLNALRNKLAHRYGQNLTADEVKELFVGLDGHLPYQDVLDSGVRTGVIRYAAFIVGSMLPKYERIDD